MKNELKGKYFIKTKIDDDYTDITALFDGVRVLTVDGFFAQGEAVNIYNEQWVNSQTEDFYIADTDEDGNPKVIYKNVDIEITFIVGQRYATSTIDVGKVHDAFIRRLTRQDVWIKSLYAHKEAHCVSLEAYAPTTVKLCRGNNSCIVGTIKLHTLEMTKEIETSNNDDDEQEEAPDDGAIE